MTDPVETMLELTRLLNTGALIVAGAGIVILLVCLYATLRRTAQLDQWDEDHLGIRRS